MHGLSGSSLWPVFSTVAAVAVNVGVIVAVLIDWPPSSIVGG
jgi:hypothetical protein